MYEYNIHIYINLYKYVGTSRYSSLFTPPLSCGMKESFYGVIEGVEPERCDQSKERYFNV